MKKFVAIILSICMLMGIMPTLVFANNGAEDFTAIRDVSGVGGAVDITYFYGKYYAITPTVILVSSDMQKWDNCYENMRYKFNKIEVLNNQLVIMSYGQSYNPDYGTTWYTDIITSSDGVSFTAHQTQFEEYDSIAFFDGAYYVSYKNSSEYFVASTTDFESYIPIKIFTGEYYSSPKLISDNNGLYLYSSGISGTLLYQLTDGTWKPLKNDTNIVTREIESINGTLYGVMIKKSTPRETWLYRYEQTGWVGVCKIFDGERVNGSYFIGNRVAVLTSNPTDYTPETYLSSPLTDSSISFFKTTGDLFSSATYHVKAVNEKTFVFDSGSLPKISEDLTGYQSIGTPLYGELQMAAGNGTALMLADGKLYSMDKTSGDMTARHQSESVEYSQIYFKNGQFHIFGFNQDTDSYIFYTTTNGITLSEKILTFTDEYAEPFPMGFMVVQQFEYAEGSYKLLLSRGDGDSMLFESENGADYAYVPAEYDGAPIPSLQSYIYGGGNVVAFASQNDESTLYYSTDGVSFQVSAIDNGSYLSGVTYEDGKFIAYGWNADDGPAIYTSATGESFTKQVVPMDGEITQLIKVENGYYAILHDYMQSKKILYSADLQNFSVTKSNLHYGYMDYNNNAAEELGGYYRFAKGDDVVFAYSLDGMIYQKSITPPTEYSVAYNLNGGSGTIPPTAKYTAGTGFVVTNMTPTKANYTFKGWSDGQTTYQANAAYPATNTNVTLTAVWEENAKYTVSYNVNGGNGSMPENTQYYINTGFTITNVIPILVNHTFAGWNDGKNIYQKGASHPGSDSADITLTAVWQENGKYTVTYSLDGGEGTTPAPQSYYENAGFTITSSIPTRAHHTFNGWSDGTNTYSSGATYPATSSNVTFTAIWEEDAKYSVAYDLNGGTGTVPNAISYYAGDKTTIATAPTRTDYIFKGWSDGTSVLQPNAEYTIPTKAVTFTAQWEKIPTYTASFTGDVGAIGNAPESKTLASGKLFTLPENPFTKTNCTFKGWSDGKKTYQPKQSYIMPEGGVTFTAVWEEKAEYRVTVHNAEELIAALNNAPYNGDIGTVILANNITDFNEINLPLSAKNGIGQKQNVVLDLQGYTLAGDESGQYFTNSGTVKITGTKDGKLQNCTIYAKAYSKIAFENITVSYRARATERVDFLLNEGEASFNNCKVDLDYTNGKCGDGSSLTAVRNLPSGTVYVNEGSDIDAHTLYHGSGDAVEGHKDGTWYGIENLGTVYLQGGAIHSAGPSIFNVSGIYHEKEVKPKTILTSGHLFGFYAVSKHYYDNRDEAQYTVGSYTLSKGSYVDLGNYNPATGKFEPDYFIDVSIRKTKNTNTVLPEFAENLSGQYVYPQNESAPALSVSANGVSLSYTWYRNAENTIVGATRVGTEKTYTPSTADKGTYYYFVVVQSTQNDNGKTIKPILISDSAKVTVVPSLSDKPIELNHTTGIKLNAAAGVLPDNTVIQITPVKDGGNFTLVSSAMNGVADKFAAFDITLLSDGVEIQPNGKVKIRIPIPKDFGTDNLIIYRVNVDGSKTPYTVKVADGFAKFETDHFSLYVLAVKSKADTSKTESPQTGDNSSMLPFAILASLSGLTLIGLTIKKKRLRNKKY